MTLSLKAGDRRKAKPRRAVNVVSFSGGKDSTAMLLMMLERGEPIHSVVFFDGGWEFPKVYEHLDLLESRTGLEIIRLKPERSFHYWMFERPIVAREGLKKGKVHRIGNGWPDRSRRWCTREKVRAIHRYLKNLRTFDAPCSCIGFASDEQNRVESWTQTAHGLTRYPLIEWGVTEADALDYCTRRGYFWQGLYQQFPRLGCYCCPLQGIESLRRVWGWFPGLWAKMLEMEDAIPPIPEGRRFKGKATVHDLDVRFRAEWAKRE